MNSLELKIFATRDAYTKKSFLGVFARDELPSNIIKYPASLILNNEKKNQPGEHWIALFITKNNCYFFDSFGNRPQYYRLYSYLKKFSKKIIYNNQVIQDYDSHYCGHYCLYFLFLKSRGFGLDHIKRLFSKTDKNFNDLLIKNLLKYIFFLLLW
jgi:hypothetical protein